MAGEKNASFSVIKDQKYRDFDQENTDFPCKNKLDLFMPKDSDENTPLVVFVHGGGWMRGDRRAYRHFISIYNPNFVLALVMAFYDAYSNVGKVFARNGVACAVVSYRLSRFDFPWLMVESILCPLVLSLIMISAALLACLLLLSRSLMPLNSLISMDLLEFVTCLVVFSLLILWIIVCYYNRRCIISKYERILPVIMSIILAHLTPLPYLMQCWLTWLAVFLLLSLVMFHQARRPGAKHPSHVSDVAKSIAWLKGLAVKSKMYSCNSIFLCGHSAGGHLVSLLALDSSYLERVGMSLTEIKGVISISGVYNLHKLSGGITEYLFLRPVFGEDEKVWTHASPSHQLSKQTLKQTSENHIKIPFLIINAAHDPLLKEDAFDFVAKLKEQSHSFQYVMVPNVNHFSIILKFGCSNGEVGSTEQYCLSFVKQLVGEKLVEP